MEKIFAVQPFCFISRHVGNCNYRLDPGSNLSKLNLLSGVPRGPLVLGLEPRLVSVLYGCIVSCMKYSVPFDLLFYDNRLCDYAVPPEASSPCGHAVAMFVHT